MRYHDISHEAETLYQLSENEEVVFFILNRTGKITIELAEPGASAHVFAFYTGVSDSKQALDLIQRHSAPDTISSALVKTALGGNASFAYDGAIVIEARAHRADASQESRVLLLSGEARAKARPALEILAHDVKCHHAATTAPLNPEALFFAEARGISKSDARNLLVRGFFQEALERMEKLGVKTDTIHIPSNILTT